MPRPMKKSPAYPLADTVAAQVVAGRKKRGLSVNKLAKSADVSRRHLAELEKGANVSVLLLRDVMNALNIPDMDIGDGKRVRVLVDHNHAALATLADDIERAGALILRSAATLRAILHAAATQPQAQEPAPSPSPSMTRADHTARAANLIAEFTEIVRNSSSDEQVEQLQQLVQASSVIATTPPRPGPIRTRKTSTA